MGGVLDDSGEIDTRTCPYTASIDSMNTFPVRWIQRNSLGSDKDISISQRLYRDCLHRHLSNSCTYEGFAGELESHISEQFVASRS